MAKFMFGSSEMLGVRRIFSDKALFKVEADVKGIDSSPEGVLRALLMARASEQLFGLITDAEGKSEHGQVIELLKITEYYLGEGSLAIFGEDDDVMPQDLSPAEALMMRQMQQRI